MMAPFHKGVKTPLSTLKAPEIVIFRQEQRRQFFSALTPPKLAGITLVMLIYKIFRADEWAELERAGETRGAPVDLEDGYIHFSTGAQVAETCAKYFAGVTDLVLAVLDSEDFGPSLKWEPSRGGALFPHLYRRLRRKDVTWHRELPLGPDGRHVFPEGVLE